jgi:dTDP-4-amino-4,6-dideoxygalactose transaminase
MINVFEPQIEEDDIAAVVKVLRSKWIGKGPVTQSLEVQISQLLEVQTGHILTTNSCTEAAFVLAQYLYSIGKRHAYLPSMSFVGVANAFKANNFQVNFLDVAEESCNIEISNIAEILFPANSVLILNQYNNSSESINSIAEFCRNHEITLIEDAAGAFGGRIGGKLVGTFGDFGIWSLDAMKTVTGGDLGIIYVADLSSVKDLRERLYLGLMSESGFEKSGQDFGKWWEFEISGPYRRAITNDISSALALSQLNKLNQKIEKRQILKQRYKKNLSGINQISMFRENKNCEIDSAYIMPVRVLRERDALAVYLKERGIYTTFRYFPLHHVEYYKASIDTPVTNIFAKQLLLLPLHTGLEINDIDFICEKIGEFFLD